jgi:hypothetical protein
MKIFNDTLDEYVLQTEYLAWSKDWGQRKTSLRFGQYICNKYLVIGKSAPDIFYAENVGDAYWKIVDVLIKQEI